MEKCGSNDYQYEVIRDWAKVPSSWSLPDVCGITIDAKDRVYVLNRSDHPIIVFDSNGNVINSWGEGVFGRAHGSGMDSDGFIYCADDVSHVVYKFTPEGKLAMTLGNKGQPSDTGFVHTPGKTLTECLSTIKRGGPPFNRPTGVSVSSKGDIFVSDGYGNARVHRFSAKGELLLSWGEPGTLEGQFKLPHSVRVDSMNQVWVVDRENGRIQIFDVDGTLLNVWKNLSRPTDLRFDTEGVIYISELNRRISIFSADGNLLARFGSQGEDPEHALFVGPHTLAVDSQGNLYVGEVAKSFAGVDRGIRTIQKFVRKR